MPSFQPSPSNNGEALTDQQGHATFPFKQWLQAVQQWLSSKGAPATKTSAGTPIQIQGLETDGTYLYVCYGVNKWRRVLLSDF